MDINAAGKTIVRQKTGFAQRIHRIWEFKVLYLFMIPGILVLLVFNYTPMVGLVTVFQSYDPLSGFLSSPWVGLDNFRQLFSTPAFSRALKNTLVISSLKLFVEFPLPIVFALLLNELRMLRFKKIVQTVTYMPNFISWVIVAGIWYKMLAPEDGIVNQIITGLGLSHTGIDFLGSKTLFYVVIILSDLWKNLGFQTIFYLAAITSVDIQLYEAAVIDGAGKFKQAVYITLPQMKSIIILMLIFAMSGLLNAGFDQMWTMGNPMVIDVADILDTAVMRYITNSSFDQLSVGAAMGFFKAGVGLILFIIANWISKVTAEESLV